MENKITKKTIIHTLVTLAILAVGFFTGRMTINDPEPKVITKYIQGETISKSILSPYPVRIIFPADTADIIKQCVKDGIYSELFPDKIVKEIEYIETSKADSSAIIADWGTERIYNEVLFNADTLGTCIVDVDVQYNRLKSFDYQYTPVIQRVEVTEYKKKAFAPFVGMGALINPSEEGYDPSLKLSTGAFIADKYGLQLDYIHNLSTNNGMLGGSVLMKF